MFEKLKQYNIYFYISLGLFCILAGQVIVLVMFNLTQIKYHIGYDASSLYLKTMEMVKQGSLFISNWSEQTSLYLDSPVPIAALIYAVTGNIFVSYGMANCIILAAVLILFYMILKSFGISNISKLVCLNMVTCTYITPKFQNGNDLSYFSCVLSSANWYGLKILLMLMVIKIFIDLEEEKYNVIYIIVTEILLFVSGVSSGWYMLVTVILPLLVYYIIKMFIRNSYKEIINAKTVILLITISAVLLGKVVAVQILNFNSRDSNMVLVSLYTFWQNLGAIILGFMELVGAFPYHSDQNVMTIEGIIYLLGTIVFIICMIGFIYAIKCLHKKYTNSRKIDNYCMLICIVIFNLIMFSVIYTTYGSEIFESRYLIPIFFILVITVGGFIDFLGNGYLLKKFGLLSVFFVYLFLNIYYDDLFFINKINYDTLETIAEEMERLDIPVVYMYGNNLILDGKNLRVVDKHRIYKIVSEESSNIAVHNGDYTYYDDVATMQGKNAIITTDEYYSLIPEYIRNKYVLQTKIDNYCIYTAETNRLDLKSGIEGRYGLDYTYSPGFVFSNGTFDESSGSFMCDGETEGYAIWGPYVDMEAGNYEFVIHYEVLKDENQAAEFIVSSDTGNKILGHIALDKEKKTASLNIDIEKNSSAVEYKVYNYIGTVLRVDYFEIFKINQD